VGFAYLFHLLQGGNTTTLSSRITSIESKLLEITGTVAQVLETCNENARSIQSLNSIILEFMRQMSQIGKNVGSPQVRRQPLTGGTNPPHMVGTSKLQFRKGKILALDFDGF
jgi:hypothetical protein